MKTSSRPLLIAALSLLALPLSTLRLKAEQPQMTEAIEQLEKARHSEHPIEHLDIARHHLEEAEHNKHGERAEALRQVNEAIAAARKDEHRRMEEHIDIAIKEVREGRHDARR